MSPKPVASSGAAIRLQDIYYILFRHKWLVLTMLALTGVAVGIMMACYPTLYESHAKLILKYIQQSKPLTQSGYDSQVVSMIGQDDSIIAAETYILTSFDVAKQVAQQIGPEKILDKINHGTNLLEAAAVIQLGLNVPLDNRRTDVIQMTFTHRDREIVQPVIMALIDAYIKEHNTIRKSEYGDTLNEEIDRITSQLQQTEKSLSDERNRAGIFSLAEGESAVGSEISSCEASIAAVEADLADERAKIAKRREEMGAPAPVTHIVKTNATVAKAPAELPRSVITQYQFISQTLGDLRAKEQGLLEQFTTNYPGVQDIESQVASKEAERRQLIEKYPELASSAPSMALSPVDPLARARVEDPYGSLNDEIAIEQGLEARYAALTNELAAVKAKAAQISDHEGKILQAQREVDLYAERLKVDEERREEAKTDDMVGPQNSSIAVLEQPTPAVALASDRRKKCLSVLLGGLFIAFGLPFLIDLYLDHTLKRQSDVQNHLKLPVFVSIPKAKINGKSKALVKAPTLQIGDGEQPESPPGSPLIVQAPGAGEFDDSGLPEEHHVLRPFFEALRDRLMTYFEMINLTHKPKLVAITSCNDGAGVTTTAVGLAAALSEVGEGNVLLINMNNQNRDAQSFHKGKPACGIEEALEKTTRDHALVHERLYMAEDEEQKEKLSRILPKRFSHLVGKMKASDYDYIIFDMPPMSQISITPRLARFMDIVLLVVESEKTMREAGSQAGTALTDAKTNVGVILNKRRSYLPRWMPEEM